MNGLAHGRAEEPIVRALVSMAHHLGMAVTAEGVETHDQLAFLRSLGCDTVQGYLVCQPMLPEALTNWLQERILGEPPSALVAHESKGPLEVSR